MGTDSAVALSKASSGFIHFFKFIPVSIEELVFPRFIECGSGRQLGAMLMATSKKAYKTYDHVQV